MAAFLAAGIGSFTLGLIVILNATGMFSIPALYAPAGGVTGRTTLAVAIWLIAWVVLHVRWRDRQIAPQRVHVISLTLIGLGILLALPPVWRLF